MVLFSVAFDVHSNSVNYIKLTAAMEAKVNILILRVNKCFGIVVWPGYLTTTSDNLLFVLCQKHSTQQSDFFLHRFPEDFWSTRVEL